MTVALWFRRDLRLADNAAFTAAIQAARAQNVGLRALFVFTPKQYAIHGQGNNQLAFMRENVLLLDKRLQALGIPFDILFCPTYQEVPDCVSEYCKRHQIRGLYASTEIEHYERLRDQKLLSLAVPLRLFDQIGILPLGRVLNQSGQPYRVFTPYSRRWFELASQHPLTPLPEPSRRDVADLGTGAEGHKAAEWLTWLPKPTARTPKPHAGEAAAHRVLASFVADELHDYSLYRDVPDLSHTSELSAYLALGVLSARQCLAAAMEGYPTLMVEENSAARPWIRQLVWREFYANLMWGEPRIAVFGNFQARGDAIQWRQAEDEFEAWSLGRTGYPLVDAGMRQLLATGWMHNRVRMVVASFLCKHLLIDWRRGEAFFARHLIDLDPANNNGGWQWCAGTGVDAQPYFRMFNPQSQAQRYDPDAAYIRQWVPELALLPAKTLLGNTDLHALSLDQSYPLPLVEHRFARQRALDVLSVLKKT